MCSVGVAEYFFVYIRWELFLTHIYTHKDTCLVQWASLAMVPGEHLEIHCLVQGHFRHDLLKPTHNLLRSRRQRCLRFSSAMQSPRARSVTLSNSALWSRVRVRSNLWSCTLTPASDQAALCVKYFTVLYTYICNVATIIANSSCSIYYVLFILLFLCWTS